MSTSFEVYPSINKQIDIEQLIRLTNKRVNEYLRIYGMEFYETQLQAFLYNKDIGERDIDNMLLQKIDDGYSLGFDLPNIPGAFWLYYHEISELDYEVWREEVESKKTNRDRCKIILENLKSGYYWEFVRYAGQHGIINLAYGMAAASLAELTNGLLYSSDSAWDYDRFPALPQEFYDWYLKPRFATIESDREFAQNSIESMRSDLRRY